MEQMINGKLVKLVALVDPLTGLAAVPQATLTSRSGTITLGGTAQQLAAANTARKGFMVQNNSAGVLWINELGAPAVTAQPSISIQPNAMYVSERDACPTGAISIIGATTAQAFTAREW